MTTHLMLFSEHPPIICVVHDDHDDKWVCCLPFSQMKSEDVPSVCSQAQSSDPRGRACRPNGWGMGC